MSKRPSQVGFVMRRPSRTRAVDVSDDLRRGDFVDDSAFDAIYSTESRAVSRCYWTPVSVAQQAADLFVQAGASRVLDVGSGVGKFAIVASLRTDLDVCGVEHRAHLVEEARDAAEVYDAPARFIHGSIARIRSRSYDGFYLYNPFGENLAQIAHRLDATVRLGRGRFARDVERVEAWLENAPIGTPLITYNGFGGRIPASFQLTSAHRFGSCHLRLWTKEHRSCDSGAFFLEHRGTIMASRPAEVAELREEGV